MGSYIVILIKLQDEIRKGSNFLIVILEKKIKSIQLYLKRQ